eukprot:10653865-Lingulodinium_polyedra.AAC.1
MPVSKPTDKTLSSPGGEGCAPARRTCGSQGSGPPSGRRARSGGCRGASAERPLMASDAWRK